MINPRISAVWNTTKPIAAFSCTPRVPEVHTKAKVVHLTPAHPYIEIATAISDYAIFSISPQVSNPMVCPGGWRLDVFSIAMSEVSLFWWIFVWVVGLEGMGRVRKFSAKNVLLERATWKAKLSDFGSARLAALAVTKGEGCFLYAAPEMYPSLSLQSAAKLPPQTTKVDSFQLHCGWRTQ